mmetsp:Transcript_9153/g.27068  ORF Transcript_9153/g.27068 Transcript_9153/m.27068 type:complete len:358 (-) Transcript_9153:30-1103(-)
MAGPSTEQRLARLTAARDSATELMRQPPARWENECEGIFKEFRVACVHLRRDREVLDSLEDKEAAWRFICKFCRERPFWHDRCNEVLRILMLSDLWMRKFIDDPEVDERDLPPSIIEEFSKRADEVDPNRARRQDPASASDAARHQAGAVKDPGPPPEPVVPDGPMPTMPSGMAVVVQRCVRARVLVDERANRWGEIGQGLVVSVTFSHKATQERVRSAARFLLTAKLSTSSKPQAAQSRLPLYGSDADSIVNLCKQGEAQGVLVIPQASLLSNVGSKDLGLQYDDWCMKDAASMLYNNFADALRAVAWDAVLGPGFPKDAKVPQGICVPTIACGTFTGRQVMDVTSSGPFMHSFNF